MRSIFSHIAAVCTLFWPTWVVAQPDVTVFAAASLRDALEEAVAGYEGQVVVSYGGSGQIARQVAQGAPADLIILANEAWVDWLEEREALVAQSRNDLVGNRLVLVGPSGSAPLSEPTKEALFERLDGGRLAIGQVDGVPAGIYGRQWLEAVELWSVFTPHLAQAENVRAALLWVAREEAPLGIVYASDAQAEASVDVLYDIPSNLHDEIVYPMAMVAGRENTQAERFALYLYSPAVQDIFLQQGFMALETEQ
ncbi:Molybdate-binding periplasmic protein precursor [Roseovarius albus]|uniref:Molybdate-binding periplasmic protein n=1 Tax=Roseovarius albus TaxID=1247867 RepID=A0A1X6Y8V9_9RHOB|nr:molybdate ABC transporter substrate-binding protein [Roseovarius albus]SLN14039.1 Molybdate-binding periplasmic protein precursor [Roseovarius albus]